jgi:hypothetical protein
VKPPRLAICSLALAVGGLLTYCSGLRVAIPAILTVNDRDINIQVLLLRVGLFLCYLSTLAGMIYIWRMGVAMQMKRASIFVILGLILSAVCCVQIKTAVYAINRSPTPNVASLAEQERTAKARAEIYLFEQVVLQYHTLFGRYPSDAERNADVTFGPGSQQDVIKILSRDFKVRHPSQLFRGVDEGSIKNGVLVDPWGVPYSVTFDVDGDGNCTIGKFGVITNKRATVWSESSPLLLPHN